MRATTTTTNNDNDQQRNQTMNATTIATITLNVQRINVRRAIAEALSTDIADVEHYQRDTDCEGFRCQQYQTGGHVFIAVPARRWATLSTTEHAQAWRVVAQVGTATMSQLYVVLQRRERDTLTEVTPGPELRYLLHCSIHGEHSISEAQYLRELQLGDSAWACYAAPGCPGDVRPVGDDEHEGTLDGQHDLTEDYPGQRISAPGDSPAPRDYAAERANLQRVLDELPDVFGLRAFPGKDFRVSRQSSFVDDSGQPSLVVQANNDSGWQDFGRDSEATLRAQITAPQRPGVGWAYDERKGWHWLTVQEREQLRVGSQRDARIDALCRLYPALTQQQLEALDGLAQVQTLRNDAQGKVTR